MAGGRQMSEKIVGGRQRIENPEDCKRQAGYMKGLKIAGGRQGI
jgi:hypothetical protein